MSFADLEAGRPLPSLRRQQNQQPQDPSHSVAAGIFKINTAVSSFHRLVNTLGTPKDTLDLRDRLLVFPFSFLFPFYCLFAIPRFSTVLIIRVSVANNSNCASEFFIN